MGGLPVSTVNGFAIHPSNPKLMWVGMRDGILRTDNAGGRWTPLVNGPKHVGAVALNPRQPREILAATSDGRVFRSMDGGDTWDDQR